MPSRSQFFRRFIESLMIRPKDKPYVVPFVFNEAQELAWNQYIAPCLDERKAIRLIVLKARQLGISTLIQGLLTARFVWDRLVNEKVIAHEGDSTKNIWGMADRMIEHCPFNPYVRRVGTTLEMGDSRYSCSTAGSPHATRGMNITALHASETAFWPHPEAWLAAMQTVPIRGESWVFIESTPNGKVGDGKLFYDEWTRSFAGKSKRLKPLFLPWLMLGEYELPNYVYADDLSAHDTAKLILADLDQEEREMRKMVEKVYGVPLRAGQLAWRRLIIEDQCRGDVDLFHQEYPTTPEEAFIQTGLPLFRTKDMLWFRQHIRDGKRFRLEMDGRFVADPDGYVQIWQAPEPGHKYLIGADTSMGFADEQHSRSAAEIIDLETMEQVGEYDCSSATHVMARHLAILGRRYNEAMLVPEITASGGGGGRELLVYLLKEHHYYNIYRYKHVDHVKQDQGRMWGWECVDPDAKVLTDDLRWIPARQLQIGSRILGCVEHSGSAGVSNALRWQTVVDRKVFIASRIEVTLENGQVTTVSDNHPFWARRGSKKWKWTKASELRSGDVVNYMPMWDTLQSYDAGRLSAFLDGEGHLSHGQTKYGFHLFVSQVEGPLAEEICGLWKSLGFPTIRKFLRHKHRPLHQPIITSGVVKLVDVLRALGSLRPSRLLRKFSAMDLKRFTLKSLQRVKVKHLRVIEDGPVIGLTTGPDHTLIADGIVGHNTNSKTRPRMVSRAIEAVSEHAAIIHSEALLQQMQSFGENDSGRLEALAGHDDLFFAWSIAITVRSEEYIDQTQQGVKEKRQLDELQAMGIRAKADPTLQWELDWEERYQMKPGQTGQRSWLQA